MKPEALSAISTQPQAHHQSKWKTQVFNKLRKQRAFKPPSEIHQQLSHHSNEFWSVNNRLLFLLLKRAALSTAMYSFSYSWKTTPSIFYLIILSQFLVPSTFCCSVLALHFAKTTCQSNSSDIVSLGFSVENFFWWCSQQFFLFQPCRHCCFCLLTVFLLYISNITKIIDA